MGNREKRRRLKRAPSMNNSESGFESNASGEPKTSAGALLRAAREQSGLHIAALAVMLKVPVKKLEALETSRFDLLPDMVFARALASSVCRTLKIDATPVLELLPQIGSTQLAYRASAVNTSFRAPNDALGPSLWSRLPKPAFLAVVILLLASLIVAFLPAVTAQFHQISSLVEAQLAEGNISKGSGTASKDSATGAVGLKSDKVLSDIPVASVGATTATTAPTGAQASSAVAPPSDLQNSSLASGAVAPPGIVIFRAVGESWVEVLDAKRQTVLRRTLTTGESVGVSGALPLSATVGRANMTQVEVRGQAFDLAPWSKENVARFEVK
jgi:cytoskeleton protein RodZ